MEHSRIFKRAWNNVRHYRASWVFGIILALTAFSWESALFLGRDNGDNGSDRGTEIVR